MRPSEARSAIVLELAEEFLDRYRLGQRPSLREYVDRHPELAEEIREVFPAMAMLEDVASRDGPLESAPAVDRFPAAIAWPERFGDYRILREVGRGGMGIVYEAEQLSLGRRVALKVLPRGLAHDARRLARFDREARAAARLHHTNIVPVFGVGEHDGAPFYVMQFISGPGLDVVRDELCRLHGKTSPATDGPSAGSAPVPRRDEMATSVVQSLLTGRFEQKAGAGSVLDNRLTSPSTEAEASPGATNAASAPLPSRPECSPSARFDGSSEPSALKVLSGPCEEGVPGRSAMAAYWRSVARIGAQAADALEYSHQQGVLHRDIKPSNLLLDVRGTVWVADFGLAKANDHRDLTRTGDVLGTLRYMPPEALKGRAGARGDIYALGLVLYELLAFQPAFDGPDRSRLIGQVMDEGPRRVRLLNPDVPRDLETIVHKAIDRDPGRRYATSGELAADLRRFYNDEPILARRATRIERSVRWCRHNRLVAGLAASLIGVLIAATVASSLGLARMGRLANNERSARQLAETRKDAAERARRAAESALRDAEAQRRRAEANFAMARAAVDEYLTRISESRLLKVPGMQPLRRELLGSALRFYQGFLKERGDDPTIRVGLAEARRRIARIYHLLGKKGKALSQYQEARRLYQSALWRNPDDREARQGLALVLVGMGRFDDAIAEWERLVRAGPENPRYKKQLAWTYLKQFKWIRALPANGDGDAVRSTRALGLLRQSLASSSFLALRNPKDEMARIQLGNTLFNLGHIVSEQGQYCEANAQFQRAIGRLQRAYERAPTNIYLAYNLAAADNLIGVASWAIGEKATALRHFQEAAEIAKRTAMSDPAVSIFQADVYNGSWWLYWALRELGKTSDAVDVMRQARPVLERLTPWTAADHYRLAVVRSICASPATNQKNAPGIDGDGQDPARTADLAIEALTRAIDLGFHDVNRLVNTSNFEAVRDRGDFQRLVARARDVSRKKKGEARVEPHAQDFSARRGSDPPQQSASEDVSWLAKAAKTARAGAPGTSHEKGTGPVSGTAQDEPLATEPRDDTPRELVVAFDPSHREIEAEIAAGQHAIGLVLLNLNRPDEARGPLDQARALRERLLKEGPENARARAELAATMIAQARLMIARGQGERKAGRTAEGERLGHAGTDLWTRAEALAPESHWCSIGQGPILQAVGGDLARRGHWASAAALYGRHEGRLPKTFQGYARATRACFFIMAGKRDEFQRLSRAALDRDGRSDDLDARLLALHPGILAPDGPAGPRAAVRVAEEAAKRRGATPFGAFYVLGAARYRGGQYDEAVGYCRRSAMAHWKGAMLNWPVLALAYHQLGNETEARKALEKAARMAGGDGRGAFDWDRALAAGPRDFMLWMEMMVWLREAEAAVLANPALPAGLSTPGGRGTVERLDREETASSS